MQQEVKIVIFAVLLLGISFFFTRFFGTVITGETIYDIPVQVRNTGTTPSFSVILHQLVAVNPGCKDTDQGFFPLTAGTVTATRGAAAKKSGPQTITRDDRCLSVNILRETACGLQVDFSRDNGNTWEHHGGTGDEFDVNCKDLYGSSYSCQDGACEKTEEGGVFNPIVLNDGHPDTVGVEYYLKAFHPASPVAYGMARIESHGRDSYYDYNFGLISLDVTNPRNPKPGFLTAFRPTIQFPSLSPHALVIGNNYLYIVQHYPIDCGTNHVVGDGCIEEFSVWDIMSNPLQPQLIADASTPFAGKDYGVESLVFFDHYVYALSSWRKLFIFDVINPRSPRLVKVQDYDSNFGGFGIAKISGLVHYTNPSRDLLYAYLPQKTSTQDISEIKVLDLSNRENPSVYTSFPTYFDDTQSTHGALLYDNGVTKHLVYIEVGRTRDYDNEQSLIFVDITNPNAIVMESPLTFTIGIQHIARKGKYLYVITTDFFAPEQASIVDLESKTVIKTFTLNGGSNLEFFVQGDVLYTTSHGKFMVYDIINPLDPQYITSLYGMGNSVESRGSVAGVGIAQFGNYLYQRTNDGLAILDKSDPEHVKLVKVLDDPGLSKIHDVVEVDPLNKLLFYPEDWVVRIYDLSNPLDPQLLSNSISVDGPTYDFFVNGQEHRLYIGNSFGFLVYDITDPRNPSALGSWPVGRDGIYVDSNHVAYATDGYNGVYILDVSNPAAIQELAHYQPPEVTQYEKLIFDDHYLYIESWLFHGTERWGVDIFDVADPRKPVRIATIDPVSTTGYDLRPIGMEYDHNNHLFVAFSRNYTISDGDNIGPGSLDDEGIFIYDISDRKNPLQVRHIADIERTFFYKGRFSPLAVVFGEMLLDTNNRYIYFSKEDFFVLPIKLFSS